MVGLLYGMSQIIFLMFTLSSHSFEKMNSLIKLSKGILVTLFMTLHKDLETCRLRLDPEMDRHRYERKISFAGILDENEDSKDSLHSSSHTLKSDTGYEEKKGMGDKQLIKYNYKYTMFIGFH